MVHPIAGLWFYFLFFYICGIHMTDREKNIAKHSLPLSIKRVLFFGSNNQFTLNTIIYQITLFVLTIIALATCYLDLISDKNKICFVYVSFMLVLLIIEVFFLIKVEKIERVENKALIRKNKELKEELKQLKIVEKSKKKHK